MFTFTISGNTIAELFDNLGELVLSAGGDASWPFPPKPVALKTPGDPAASAAPLAPTAPTAPAVVPITAPLAAAPTSTVATATPAYTLDQLARAGAVLSQSGKMQDALNLLAKYGVQTINQLKPEQYGAFATELRSLGARV